MKHQLLFLVAALLCCSFGQPQQNWLALGDSITYLNEHPNETGNRITKGYMTLVTEKHPRLRYINQGHNGWTAAETDEYPYPEAAINMTYDGLHPSDKGYGVIASELSKHF